MTGPDEKCDRLGELMRLAQGGDRSAYDRLLHQCAEIARRVLRRRYPHLPQSDAEDLVQDVLLSLHTVRATYDVSPDGKFLVNQPIAEDEAERNERIFPSRLRIALNWSEEVRGLLERR